MIEIKNLSKVYKKSNLTVQALDKVSLSVSKGDVFGIIGLSGAGKSSLVRCINRLETPSEGEILFKGEDLLKLSPALLRKKRQEIGMIFQNFNLFSSKTVYENIAFPLRIAKYDARTIHNRVLTLLKRVGLEEKKDMYPANLSGGQKQRVGIARALACEPKVLLCDEATSALDPQTTKQTLSLLKELNEETGLTLIVITHEMDVIKAICNKVAILENGQVIESGHTTDVFTKPHKEETKHFLGEDQPPIKRHPEATLVKLIYTGEMGEKPVISELIKTYDVSINILSGTIEPIQGVLFGKLYVTIEGSDEAKALALGHLEKLNIDVEVIHD